MTKKRDRKTSSEPIAIVGMAGLFPKAGGLKQYWRLIRRGEDAVTEVPASHWPVEEYFDADPKSPDRTYCRRGAFLSATDFDPTEFGIPPAALEATDTAQLLSLVAAGDALRDAGYGEGRRPFDRTKTSVILGVTGTLELVIPLAARLGHPLWKRALRDAGVAAETADDVVRRISGAYVPWQENSFPGLLGNVVAGRIANRLDLKGTNCVVDAACASSLSALHLASLELATGKSDMVLTGGVDTLNDIFMFMCFSKTQALSASGDAKPFDATADGTVIGEGVGIVLLKRLVDAQRDGDRVYAVLRGIGTSSDGRSQSIYAPRSEGQASALRDAYARAGVDPSTVELVEAHGTGTKVGDAVEFDALQTVYREASPGEAWCALGSVKSQIGHTKAASGAASLIKAALALHHKVLPPTIKTDTPNPKLAIEKSPFYLNTAARPWLATNAHPRRAAISSFGFGGSNFHAVLEEYPGGEVEPAWDGSVEIVALSAPDRGQLANVVNSWRSALSGGLRDDAFAARAAASRRAFVPDHAHRVVLVVENSHDDDGGIKARFDAVADALDRNDEAALRKVRGAHVGGAGEPGKVAFLFPGQASQYVGMGRDWFCAFPEARAALEEANDVGGEEGRLSDYIFPQPTLDDAKRRANEEALTRTEIAQPALGAVSLALLRVLRRFEVPCHVTAGHSFGELVALHAAGRIDDATLRHLARVRGRLMASGAGDRGTMAAVFAPLDELAALLTDRGIEVVLANRNTPNQGVISGTRAAILRATKACEGRGWRVSPLSVSGAFHSPLMAEAYDQYRQTIAHVTWRRGDIPVVANCSADRYPEDASSSGALLTSQLIQPVRFVDTIETTYAQGVRTFIEVGPKRVLSGLVKEILKGRRHQTLATDASAGRRDGLLDLADLLAQLAAEGHPVALARWEKPAPEKRKPKMVVPLLGTNYRAERKRTPAASRHYPKSVTSGSQNVKSNELESNVHPTSGAPPVEAPAPVPANSFEGVFAVVREGLRAMQALQQQTASAHQRFLETQEHAHRSFQMVMESQQRLFEKLAGVPVPERPAPPLPVASVPGAMPASPTIQPPTPLASPSATAAYVSPPAPVPAPVSAPPPPAPPDAEPASVVAGATPPAGEGASNGPASANADFETLLLEVVAELTGYPPEMLELDMDMEADLGIDSIKRVEILAAVQEKRPDLQAVDSSYMGSLRTLRDIIAAMSGSDEPEASPTENPTAGLSLPAPAQTEESSSEATPPTRLIRRVLTTVELPPAIEKPIGIAPGFEVWIVEDDSGLADALVEGFVAQGIAARVVGASAPIEGEACTPVGGLIHLFPPAGDKSVAHNGGSTEQLKGAFALTRELAGDLRRAARAGGALFATVARMDGAFGLSAAAGAYDPAHGGLAGLTKTVAHEWPGVHARALDVDPAWSDGPALARRILLELGADGPIEVGLARGARRGLALKEVPAKHGAPGVAEGDTVVVTGGARGVTADCAIALAHAVQPTLILLGRSPSPTSEPEWAAGLENEADLKRAILKHAFGSAQKPSPSELEAAYRRHVANREIRATLTAIEASGATVRYHAVDVCDRAAVAKVFDEVRRTCGPIRGIIHGAGVIEDRLIADKDLAMFDRVFDTKVAGLEALLGASAKDDLRCLVLFSSVSGRFGRQGQVDYAMANEVLNKIAQRRAAVMPACRVVSINWGPWDGGMVTPALKREFDKLGIDLIPREAGAQAMMDELHAPPGSAAEVVIGGAFPEANDIQYAIRAPGASPGTKSHNPQAKTRHISEEESKPNVLPQSDERLQTVFTRKVNIESHSFLRSHVMGGKCVLPMAVMMEWLGHGALHAHPGLVLSGLEDVRVCKGVVLSGARGAAVKLEVAASKLGKRGAEFVVTVELRTKAADGKNILNAKATAILADTYAPAPEFFAPDGLHADAYPPGAEGAYREVLFHGVDFQCVEEIVGCSPQGIVAHVASAPAPKDWMINPVRPEWIGDPLYVDAVLQLGIVWGKEFKSALSLPSYIGTYRFYASTFPPDGITSVLQVRESSPNRITADATLLNSEGAVVATLRDCRWTVDAALREAFVKNVIMDAAR